MAEERPTNYTSLLSDENNSNSLRSIYYAAEPNNTLTKRRFSQDSVIEEMVEKCKTIKNDKDFVLMLLNTAERLKTEDKAKTLTFRGAIKKFIQNNGYDESLFKDINSSAESVGSPLKFKFSVLINKRKPRWNQISSHIWLGKLPIQKDFKELLQECKPGLVVSANNKAEPQTKSPLLDAFVPSTFWAEEKIDQVFLDLFIDYGRPYRKADFKKYKYDSKTDWDNYLDKLYKQIYYACVLMTDKIKNNQNIFIHCKAGKGRSVTALAIFYMLNPSELIPGKTSLTVDEVFSEMIKTRPHIDQDAETKQAVQDCYNYIKQTLEPKNILVDDAKKYFNPQYKGIQNTN